MVSVTRLQKSIGVTEMPDGLIVKEPYATMLVRGRKKYEIRTKPLPANKTNVKILILCRGIVKGYVMFDSQLYNEDDEIFKWHVYKYGEYIPKKKYRYKNGTVIWLNNVEVSDIEEDNQISFAKFDRMRSECRICVGGKLCDVHAKLSERVPDTDDGVFRY